MLNLTKQEKGVIIFLAGMAVLGLGIKTIRFSGQDLELEVKVSEVVPVQENIDQILLEARMVNINKDDKEKIVSLPGIGPVLAGRIVQYRKINGSYQKPDQLMDVSGIGPKKFEQIKKYIVVE
ncbi:MAG: helix-hairpin-helix domain-containing protein [Candidatus Omnitrophica bacterium]|nr:helix-hairpin-helix domain-containing protein [Candidatus Omnitrophota bacterium]